MYSGISKILLNISSSFLKLFHVPGTEMALDIKPTYKIVALTVDFIQLFGNLCQVFINNIKRYLSYYIIL